MEHDVTEHVVISDTWKCTLRGRDLNGRGNIELLSRPLTAFFASRVSPALAIRAGLAWALEQVYAGAVVIGGFHSPLERSVLNLLLEARAPAVVVLAREVKSARFPVAWQRAVQQRHLAVVSQAMDQRRLDHGRSVARNELVAMLGDTIVVAHASATGNLRAQTADWQRCGKVIRVLHDERVVDDTVTMQ